MASTTTTSYDLTSVNISFLPRDKHQTKTPIVISPRFDCSLEFLTQFLEENRSWLDDIILKHGALIVRGFDVDTPESLQRAVQSYNPNLNSTYRGTSPRHNIDDEAEFVFSAAEVPSNYPIAQHIEMSFLPSPPAQLYFGCLKAPDTAGGETALADFRKVYQDIPEDLKQKFLDKGIQYTRTHKKVGAYWTYDVADMLSWPEMFGTDSKEEVEAMCKKEGIPCSWDGDTFVSVTKSNAFQLHPHTKEHVWFNHTQVFHWTTFPAELWFAFNRTYDIRLLFQFLIVSLFCLVKYGILKHKMGLDATFGDGTPISAKEMSIVRKAIHKNMVFSRWQRGDIMFIDNFSTSHGRQPTFDKGRKIAVSWSDPVDKTDEVVSLKKTTEAKVLSSMRSSTPSAPSLASSSQSSASMRSSTIRSRRRSSSVLGDKLMQSLTKSYVGAL